MADRTGIEWCDSTWNPWMGCTRVSPACGHCYAAVSTPARTLGIAWGAGQPRRRTSPSNWALPLRWNAKPFYECTSCGWRGEKPLLGTFCPRDDGGKGCGSGPIREARRRVFCASLADVFDNEVDPAWRADLFDLIAATPNLDWLLLTKRIGNVGNMLPVPFDFERHFPNVWLGATICNQAEADRDIPKLLALEARVRFLSMEPLLRAVDLNAVPPPAGTRPINGASMADISGCLPRWQEHPTRAKLRDGIDWVIAGGESGPHARPMHPDWVRSLRDQCAAAGVPFLFKQWGEWEIATLENGHHGHLMPETSERYTWVGADGRTSNPSANGLVDAYAMARVGKKIAGRRLDGQLHDGFPGVAGG